jgi:uncharacterized membrane protein YqjE
MEKSIEKTPPLFESLHRLLHTIFAILQNRLELALVEWQEERYRLLNTFLLTAMVAGLGLITLMVAVMAIVLICVQSDRLDLVVALFSILLLSTFGLFWRLRYRLKTWSPFATTLAELKKDNQCSEAIN